MVKSAVLNSQNIHLNSSVNYHFTVNTYRVTKSGDSEEALYEILLHFGYF